MRQLLLVRPEPGLSASAERARQAGLDVIARPLFRTSFQSSKHFLPALSFQGLRCYSVSAGLTKEEVTGRIMDLLKNFDKVCGQL